MISLLLAAAAPAAKVPVNAATAPAPALQVPIVPAAVPHGTAIAQHAGWLTHGLAGIFVLSAVLLILLLALQTTKQEGLSGTIGGRVESAYGRPGAEEQIKRWTGVAAVAFVVVGTILSLTGI